MGEIISYSILENTVLDYLLALGVMLGGFIAVWLVFQRLAFPALHAWAKTTVSERDDLLLAKVERSLSRLMYTAAVYVGLRMLALGDGVSRALFTAAIIMFTFFGVRLATAVISFGVEVYLRRTRPDSSAGRAVIPILRVVAWALGVAFVMDNLGFEVGALLAGLGIGGVALALASQTVLADLFSYVSILFDRPFELGDFIVDGDTMGTVEHIGIKTTRLRSVGGEQLIISNSDLTTSRLRNFKRMQERRVVLNLGVTYQTPIATLRQLPDTVRSIIEARKELRFERAHLSGLGDSAINFEIIYFVLSHDMMLHMDAQQALLLDILQALETMGASLAYPTQTLFVDDSVTKTGAPTTPPSGAGKSQAKPKAASSRAKKGSEKTAAKQDKQS
ncbi:MAG: mechanosensitive ion channel family protein [Desulfovibrio sp.]|nr:MAG: mechanosensitive ion channel family protein [Desulfovibrio sp.]